MSGEFKEIKLPPELEAKLKELLQGAMQGSGPVGPPHAHDLGSDKVPAPLQKAADSLRSVATRLVEGGVPESKGMEMLLRLVVSAATPGMLRGEAVDIAKTYDKEAWKEYVGAAAVLSQVLVQTLRHLEFSIDDFPPFEVTDGMVTPVYDVGSDPEEVKAKCNCAYHTALREGTLDSLGITVLTEEHTDPADAFTGDSGPIFDIAKALGKGKRNKGPVS